MPDLIWHSTNLTSSSKQQLPLLLLHHRLENTFVGLIQLLPVFRSRPIRERFSGEELPSEDPFGFFGQSQLVDQVPDILHTFPDILGTVRAVVGFVDDVQPSPIHILIYRDRLVFMPVGRRVRGNVQLYHLQDIEVQFGIFALLGSHKPGEVLRWLLEQHAHYLVQYVNSFVCHSGKRTMILSVIQPPVVTFLNIFMSI